MWFAIMIIGVWLISGVVAIKTEDSGILIVSLIFSVVAGIGYFMLLDR